MDSDTSLTKAEQTISVSKFVSSLPEPYLLLFCESPLQFNHWYKCKTFYTDINEILTYYFMGEAAPEKPGKVYQKILEAEVDRLLSFYDLIHCGWAFIEKEAALIGYDLHAIGATSPGKALQIIIKNESTQDFLRIKANHLEFSPQKAHKQFKQFIKMFDQKIDRDELNLLISDSRYLQTGEIISPELSKLYFFCLSALAKYINNERVKKKYNAYLEEWIDRIKFAKKLTHHRKSPRGYTTVNGEKTYR
jgi:hypothetical protein